MCGIFKDDWSEKGLKKVQENEDNKFHREMSWFINCEGNVSSCLIEKAFGSWN